MTNNPISHLSKTTSISFSHTEIDTWIAFDLEWITKKIVPAKCNIMKNASGGSEPPVFGDKYNEIVTFAFEDSHGNKGCVDITDFQSAKSFLEEIKKKLLQYQYCFAWGSKTVVKLNRETGQLEGINGDLAVLDSNFKANRIPSVVAYDKYSTIPYLKKDIFVTRKSQLKADIDLLQVFAKPLVRTSIFKNKYKSLRLDDVSKALLGYGKPDDKTGAKLDEMSVDERKSYCLHDAHLVAELVKVNDGDVLKIMQVIASHTGLTFEEICHKGMTGIWKKIINETISKKIRLVGYGNIPSVLRKLYSNNGSYERYIDYFDENEYNDVEDEELLEYKENSYDHYIDLLDQKSRNRNSDTVDDYSNITYSNSNTKNNGKHIFKNKYKGGLVLDPIRGLHSGVCLFDITSLYPTMIINNNISPETVNCSCCNNKVKARLVFDKDLLVDLQYSFIDYNNQTFYWICQHKKGLFSKMLEELTHKRIQYKNEGKDIESTAIKSIINSGYGVFGHPNFKYYDPKVAEVITALGRQTLLDMKKMAIEMDFTVLYGDTDSLFINNIKNNADISKFIDNCKARLNVVVTHEKTFRKLILVGKKHYVGIPYDYDKPVIKGMEGVKSDRPEFIRSTFRGMVEDVQKDINPIPKLKQALGELDRRQVPKERLSISLALTKNPQEYTNECLQKRLGTKLRLRKGDTFVYYKCDKQIIIYVLSGKQTTRTVGESDDPNDISYSKYREMLINSVKDVIEILGYNVEMDLLAKRKLF